MPCEHGDCVENVYFEKLNGRETYIYRSPLSPISEEDLGGDLDRANRIAQRYNENLSLIKNWLELGQVDARRARAWLFLKGHFDTANYNYLYDASLKDWYVNLSVRQQIHHGLLLAKHGQLVGNAKGLFFGLVRLVAAPATSINREDLLWTASVFEESVKLVEELNVLDFLIYKDMFYGVHFLSEPDREILSEVQSTIDKANLYWSKPELSEEWEEQVDPLFDKLEDHYQKLFGCNPEDSVLLKVDLTAPMDRLVEDFKSTVARLSHSRSIPQSYTEKRASKWREAKVLEYADILNFAQYFNLQLTDAQIANLLFDDEEHFEIDVVAKLRKVTKKHYKALFFDLRLIKSLGRQVGMITL